MKIERHEQETMVKLTAVLSTGRMASVEVYKPRKAFMADKMVPAEVNWSAFGSVSADVAAEYAQLIQAAATVAYSLDAVQAAKEAK